MIAASVQRQIDAQKDSPPKRIPIIVCLKESADHPELGVQPAKDKIKEFLTGKAAQVTESDFYLFASLFPQDIEDLADLRQWVYQIWLDETTFASPVAFHGHGKSHILLADVRRSRQGHYLGGDGHRH